MLKNTLYMMLTTGVKLMSGIVVFVILARVLGPYNFGLISYSFALVTLFVLIIDFGYSQKLLRDAAANPRRIYDFLDDALNAKLILTVITLCLCALYFGFFPLDITHQKVFTALFFASVLGSFAELFCIPLRAIGKFNIETNVTTLASVFHFVLIIILLYIKQDVFLIAIGFLVSRLCYLILAILSFRKYIGNLNYRCSLSNVTVSLKQGFPYAIDTMLTNFFYQIDSVIVNHNLGTIAVGNYQAVTKWLQGVMQMAPVLANVYLPVLSESQNDKTKNNDLAKKLNAKMLGIGVLGWATFNYGGTTLTHYIYGDQYLEINQLWPYVALLVWVRYMTGAQGVLLMTYGLQNIRVYIQAFAIIIFLSLSPILMKIYGLSGVIMSLIAAILTIFICFVSVLIFKNKNTGFNWHTSFFAVLISVFALQNILN
jgi:O-antigen/teichoic acid export membrane protein